MIRRGGAWLLAAALLLTSLSTGWAAPAEETDVPVPTVEATELQNEADEMQRQMAIRLEIAKNEDDLPGLMQAQPETESTEEPEEAAALRVAEEIHLESDDNIREEAALEATEPTEETLTDAAIMEAASADAEAPQDGIVAESVEEATDETVTDGPVLQYRSRTAPMAIMAKDAPKDETTEPPATEEPVTEEPVTEKPKPRFVVTIANENGTFEAPSAEVDTLSAAREAFAKNEHRDLVIMDRNRKIGNGVILMRRGYVITSPTKVPGQVLLTWGSFPEAYTGAGYDAVFRKGDGEQVTMSLMGTTGAIDKMANGALPVDQVELVPFVQMKNVSYYENRNGRLVHVIHTFKYDGKSNAFNAQAASITLGFSPDMFKPGQKYYSHDAFQFYSDRSLTKAVGSFAPYYKMLSFRSQSAYSASDLDRYIDSWKVKDNVLVGTGRDFKRMERKYGINAGMLLAMAAHESGRGTSAIARDKFNIFGVRATDGNPYGNATAFHSVAACIENQAHKMLHEGYLNIKEDWRFHGAHVGDKGSGLNVKYASDPYWGEKIAGHLVALDTFLGVHDTGRYSIGWTKQTATATSQPKAGASTLYTHKTVRGTNVTMAGVVITGESGDYFRIQSDTALQGGKAGAAMPYSFRDQVYVPKSQIAVRNPGQIKPGPTWGQGIRLEGASRFETAVAISEERFAKADVVLLANGETEIDALSAAPLAQAKNAPLLLTTKSGLPKAVAGELKRLQPKEVWIIGGENSIENSTFNALKSQGYKVKRIEGKNRYETSAVIAKELVGANHGYTHAFLANGLSAVDALSIGAVAAAAKQPILLTDGKTLDPAVKESMKPLKSLTIAGGSASVSYTLGESLVANKISVDRLQGPDRYATSLAIAKKYGGASNSVAMATGRVLADGLAGAGLAADYNAPLLLVGEGLSSDAETWLKNGRVDTLFALGGTNSVRTAVFEKATKAIR